jgi:hypothetical protein
LSRGSKIASNGFADAAPGTDKRFGSAAVVYPPRVE